MKDTQTYRLLRLLPQILDFKVSRMLENTFPWRLLISFGCDETRIIAFQPLLFFFKQNGLR